MGILTKASVKALRREVEAFSSNYISRDPDIVSIVLKAPKGRQALADMFAAYEAAAADVGEEEALDVAVEAALSEIDDRYAELRSGDPRGTQDIAERVLRTFVGMVQRDRSVLEHFRDAMSFAERDEDEAGVQDFYSELAHQFVRSRSGNPDGDRCVEDMSTAREMFREMYDRLVANRGHEVAQWAAVDDARTTAVMCTAIYGLADPIGVARDTEALVRSLLADP